MIYLFLKISVFNAIYRLFCELNLNYFFGKKWNSGGILLPLDWTECWGERRGKLHFRVSSLGDNAQSPRSRGVSTSKSFSKIFLKNQENSWKMCPMFSLLADNFRNFFRFFKKCFSFIWRKVATLDDLHRRPDDLCPPKTTLSLEFIFFIFFKNYF